MRNTIETPSQTTADQEFQQIVEALPTMDELLMRREAENIHKALNELMSACGFSGEIGTERLFHVLLQAIEAVHDEWDSVVGQSHRDGLCYDVNVLLAYKIASMPKPTGFSGS